LEELAPGFGKANGGNPLVRELPKLVSGEPKLIEPQDVLMPPIVSNYRQLLLTHKNIFNLIVPSIFLVPVAPEVRRHLGRRVPEKMHVLAKICGINSLNALSAALKGGADFVGLVFFEPSPRNLEIEFAARLANQARGTAKITALFVDPTDEEIRGVAERVRPDCIQLYGKESSARLLEIKNNTGCLMIKAISVQSQTDVDRAREYPDADLILYDAKPDPARQNLLPGGNGISFDWHLLDNIDKDQKFMLSGGLNPDNVRAAIRLTNAPIVDVSSGVESEPGVKDVQLIEKFLSEVRNHESS